MIHTTFAVRVFCERKSAILSLDIGLNFNTIKKLPVKLLGSDFIFRKYLSYKVGSVLTIENY